MRRIIAILNSRAGTFLDGRAPDPVGTLTRAFEAVGDQIDVVLAKPRTMGEELRRAAASPHDTVIVGGGDGTMSRALSLLSGSGKTLGVLPLGTVNILARDLNIPLPFAEAVAALASAVPVETDLALINGRPFHSVLGLGYFSHVAHHRERLRDLPLPLIGRHIAWAVSHWRAFRRSGRFFVTIEADGDKREVEALALLATVNAVSGTDWRRPRLDTGLVEIHVVKAGTAWRRAMVGRDLLSGRWRDNPDIETFAAARLSIASHRSRRWVTVDGEISRERMPFSINVVPKAVRLLAVPAAPAVPPPGPEAALPIAGCLS